MATEKGWKPIPLSLKILSVVFVIWAIGTVFAIPMRYAEGLPFFGMWVSGIIAGLIVILLDIIGPLVFLYALWNKLSWGPKLAFSYIGIFILNSIVALFTVREQLGFEQIFIPLLFNIVFIAVIYNKRSYFE